MRLSLFFLGPFANKALPQVIIATIGQAVAGHGPGVSILGVLIFWRFIMGIGIGGDYPLSATITSEFAATKIRGRMMTVRYSPNPSRAQLTPELSSLAGRLRFARVGTAVSGAGFSCRARRLQEADHRRPCVL